MLTGTSKRLQRPLKYLAKRAIWYAAPSFFTPSGQGGSKFSIAIYAGPSLRELQSCSRAKNPVISRVNVTDFPISTAADPFISFVDGRWYMHFEVLNRLSSKGEIAFASSADGFDWQYGRVVLRESFHLSYPYVFEWRGDMYMVPESGRAKAVRLYRAVRFPDRWAHAATLLEGTRFVDNSLFRYENLWWMFTDSGSKSSCPVLRLFYASELTGPWREHPRSPIIDSDTQVARPAGRVIILNGRPVRFAQSVFPVYGAEVRAFEITELSPQHYRERPLSETPILRPGAEAWNSGGMHHIDAHLLPDGSWLACVDGFAAPAKVPTAPAQPTIDPHSSPVALEPIAPL
jgi:hypothetical protein